jgi:hypothetical protein
MMGCFFEGRPGRAPWHDASQRGDSAAVAFANAFSAGGTWTIATTTPTVKRAPHQGTGVTETGC